MASRNPGQCMPPAAQGLHPGCRPHVISLCGRPAPLLSSSSVLPCSALTPYPSGYSLQRQTLESLSLSTPTCFRYQGPSVIVIWLITRVLRAAAPTSFCRCWPARAVSWQPWAGRGRGQSPRLLREGIRQTCPVANYSPLPRPLPGLAGRRQEEKSKALT